MTGKKLSGRHYNRSIRAHKIIYEVMQRMRFQVFEKSVTNDVTNQFHSIGVSVLEDFERENFTEMCYSESVNDAKKAYDLFVEKRSQENPLFALWSKYIDMVQLLLRSELLYGLVY